MLCTAFLIPSIAASEDSLVPRIGSQQNFNADGSQKGSHAMAAYSGERKIFREHRPRAMSAYVEGTRLCTKYDEVFYVRSRYQTAAQDRGSKPKPPDSV